MAAIIFTFLKYKQPPTVEIDLETPQATGDDEENSKELEDLMRVIRAASVIQKGFRRRYYKTRLDYRNLTDRLLFEHELLKGLTRLVVQVVIFALLVLSANETSSSAEKAGLYGEISNALGLDSLQNIQSREQFLQDYLPKIATQSKAFFPLGSVYFNSGNQGAVEVLKSRLSFSAPVVVVGLDINVRLANFSFTAWVRISRTFSKGYILRKRIGSTVDMEDLSCWAWYLSGDQGPQFHYGAHDFFDTTVSSGSSYASSRSTSSSYASGSSGTASGEGNLDQEIVADGISHPIPLDTDVLLTVCIEQYETSSSTGINGQIMFYTGADLLYTRPLTRQITDCNNDMEGPLLGDAGIELAQVRFYPFLLRKSHLQQIMASGELLRDLVWGKSLDSPFADGFADSTSLSQRQDTAKILRAADDQKRNTEVIDLVAALRHEATIPATAATSVAAAPHGAIAVDPIVRNDTNTGREYHSLFLGPGVLTRPTVMNDTDTLAGPRTLTNMPTFRDTGVTISWWHRHNTEAECLDLGNNNCGMYFLYARNNKGLCWSLWVQPNGIYFESGGKNSYPRNFLLAEHTLTATQSWRHVTFALDADDDSLTYYLDGRPAWKGPWSTSVSSTDCPAATSQQVAFGHQYPEWTYGLEVGVYDLRMYVGPALSPADILKLAQVPVALASLDTCTDSLGVNSGIADKLWKDALGRGCEWYQIHKKYAPSICELQQPWQSCPVACMSKQPCFHPFTQEGGVFIWDRIQMIANNDKINENNGTLCLNDKLSGLGGAGEGVRDTLGLKSLCERWRAGGSVGGSEVDWVADFKSATGKMFDFYKSPQDISSVCQDITSAVDPYCAWDVQTVKNFTADVVKNGGDFTIAFWMRPIGVSSLTEQDAGASKFTPNIVFYSSLFPPTHNLVIGGFNTNPETGEMRVHTACRGHHGDRLLENVQSNSASKDGWTFYSFVRRNATRPFQNTVFTNSGYNMETTLDPLCLYNDSALFNAIAVNYPILISPILLVPKAMPLDTIQRNYYSSVTDMQKRRGPLMSSNQRIHNTIPVDQSGYSYRSSLVAPPMICQTRSTVSTCSNSYSRQWVSLQQRNMLSENCYDPYSCGVTEMPVSCSSSNAQNSDDSFFGLNLTDIGYKNGYSDFLYSITDSAALYRNNSLRSTRDFIDKHTSTLDVVFAFFSASMGVTSVVTITADLKHAAGIKITSDVQFYDIVEGNEIFKYYSFQCAACILAIALVFFMVYSIKEAKRWGVAPDVTTIGTYVTDLVIIVLIPAGFMAGGNAKTQSNSETARIVGKWADIGWDNDEVPLDQKTIEFFNGMQELMETIYGNNRAEFLIYLVMLLNLLRMIQVTSLHPRLALMTGTLGYAAGALCHAIIVACFVFFGFAIIGVWRYGDQRAEFENVYTAIATELRIMFASDPPENWEVNGEFMLFIFLYLFFMFILVLNFILAIIVESYVQVRKDIEDCKVEQNIWEDAFGTLFVHIGGRLWGWPLPTALGHKLLEFNAKHSIGYEDLSKLGLFRDHQSVVSFLVHYSRYDFLEPEKVTKYGKAAKTMEDRVARLVERRMARLLGIKPPSIKDEIQMYRKKSSIQARDTLAEAVSQFPLQLPRMESVNHPSSSNTDRTSSNPNRQELNMHTAQLDIFPDDPLPGATCQNFESLQDTHNHDSFTLRRSETALHLGARS